MKDSYDALASQLRAQLIEQGPATGSRDLTTQIAALVDREAAVLDEPARAYLASRIAGQAIGLGPLEDLLADPEVDEIMVNGTDEVFVERRGRLAATSVRFNDTASLMHAIDRILAPLGRRVDQATPMCDARLPDGSRVNVVIAPLAIDGATLTIRRFRPRDWTPQDLVEAGTWTQALHGLLGEAVVTRRSIVVSGATGSGKTTTLNALSAFIDPAERVVTIEDAAELRLQQPHVVRLEARPATLAGDGAVTLRDLVRNTLRMRPDRIIVGEVRGAEALDMLSAMSCGHDGSLGTVHAGSPEGALRRLETLALMADVGLPLAAVRAQLASAVDLVVHQVRCPDGRRQVVAVGEVRLEGETLAVRDVYRLRDGRPVVRGWGRA